MKDCDERGQGEGPPPRVSHAIIDAFSEAIREAIPDAGKEEPEDDAGGRGEPGGSKAGG